MFNGTKRDKGAIQRSHPHYKDAAQTSRKDDSKKKTASASVLLPRRNEAQFYRTSWKTSREEGCGPLEGVRSAAPYCDRVISIFSEEGQVQTRQQSSP